MVNSLFTFFIIAESTALTFMLILKLLFCCIKHVIRTSWSALLSKATILYLIEQILARPTLFPIKKCHNLWPCDICIFQNVSVNLLFLLTSRQFSGGFPAVLRRFSGNPLIFHCIAPTELSHNRNNFYYLDCYYYFDKICEYPSFIRSKVCPIGSLPGEVISNRSS